MTTKAALRGRCSRPRWSFRAAAGAAVLVALAAAQATAGAPARPSSSGAAAAAGSGTSAAPVAADMPEGWYTRIETDKGTIVARLHPEQAPQSVANFAGFAEGTIEWTDSVTGERRSGHYYDGLLVHQAEAGKLFATGDPYGTGAGAPTRYVPLTEVGQPIDFTGAWKLGLSREPLGRVSATKFFVTASSLYPLNHRSPCIGTIVEGRDVAFAIASVKTYSNMKPMEPIRIRRVRVFKVGDPPPLEEPLAYQPPAGPRLQVREGVIPKR